MKTKIRIFRLMAFMLMIGMVSCKKDEPVLTPAELIIGKWKLIEFTNNGQTDANFKTWLIKNTYAIGGTFEFTTTTYKLTVAGFTDSQPYTMNGSTLIAGKSTYAVTFSGSNQMTWRDDTEKINARFTKQ